MLHQPLIMLKLVPIPLANMGIRPQRVLHRAHCSGSLVPRLSPRANNRKMGGAWERGYCSGWNLPLAFGLIRWYLGFILPEKDVTLT